MRKAGMRLLLLAAAIILLALSVGAKAEFDEKYEEVHSALTFQADNNSITFNSKNKTFSLHVNMFEGYYDTTGTYQVVDGVAHCDFSKDPLYAQTDLNQFIMTELNGYLLFTTPGSSIYTIENSALFQHTSDKRTIPAKRLPWETAYLEKIEEFSPGNVDFRLYDVDYNGTPELLLDMADEDWIYTYENGAVKELGSILGTPYQTDDGKGVLYWGKLATQMRGGTLYTLKNGKLDDGTVLYEADMHFPDGPATYTAGGLRVSEASFLALESKLTDYGRELRSVRTETYFTDNTRLFPYEHKPLGSQGIQVLVDGAALALDQPPVIVSGRTLVPVRAIFESLGATVNWNAATSTVTAQKSGTTITITLGRKEMKKDNRTILMDVPAQMQGSRVLVPVRAVSEALSANVTWRPETQMVDILSHEAYITAFAKSIWTLLQQQNPDGVVLREMIAADSAAYQAMLSSKASGALGNVIVDLTSASVGALVTTYELLHGDVRSVDRAVGELRKAFLGLSNDVAINDAVLYLQDMGNDDYVFNLASNAKQNNNKRYLEFQRRHSSAVNGEMNYEDALTYSTLYYALAMDSNTIGMGNEYFLNKLSDGFGESLATIFARVAVDLSTDKIEDVFESGARFSVDWVKTATMSMLDEYCNSKNPAIAKWAARDKQLYEELLQLMG